MLAPFQLPQGSRLSTRDARVIDVMRSSLVKSTFRNHDVSMRDVRFTDIFSTVTDNFSSHQCWVLGKTNSFVTNEYEVHQEHGDGSTTSGKLDLPRDGMQALSKVQVDSPEKSILALFNIASEGVAFRYALMALFFSFKASYAESEYHPSSVILGLVDENCYRVRMWANDGMRAEETAQSDQGESCAATKLQGHRVTLRVELF
jgi:hypothetical protein